MPTILPPTRIFRPSYGPVPDLNTRCPSYSTTTYSYFAIVILNVINLSKVKQRSELDERALTNNPKESSTNDVRGWGGALK